MVLRLGRQTLWSMGVHPTTTGYLHSSRLGYIRKKLEEYDPRAKRAIAEDRDEYEEKVR